MNVDTLNPFVPTASLGAAMAVRRSCHLVAGWPLASLPALRSMRPSGFLQAWLVAACDAKACVTDPVALAESCIAFCLVRPPGHHASRSSCDGYCFVNNAVLAAQTLAAAGHRVAVIDFDVHHGNGTQSIFYERADVLCVSMHMNQGAWDEGTAHPETGGADEVGAGDGIGFNLNVPLDMGSADAAHLAAFQEIVVPEVDAFKPTFIVVACGVDGSQMDPNGAVQHTSRRACCGTALARPATQHV